MNEKQTNTEVGPGLDTPAGYATTDLTAVGEGRNTVRQSEPSEPCLGLHLIACNRLCMLRARILWQACAESFCPARRWYD